MSETIFRFINCVGTEITTGTFNLVPITIPKVTGSYIAQGDPLTIDVSSSIDVVPNNYKIEYNTSAKSNTWYCSLGEDTISASAAIISGSYVTCSALVDVTFNLLDHIRDLSDLKSVTLTPVWSNVGWDEYFVTGETITFITDDSGSFTTPLVPQVYEVKYIGIKKTTAFRINVPCSAFALNANELIISSTTTAATITVANSYLYSYTAEASDQRYIQSGGTIDSASYALTASYALNGGGGGVTPSGSYDISASWASSSLSASYAVVSDSAISASYVPDLYPQTEQVSASWASSSISASIADTSLYANSASLAETASYAISASFEIITEVSSSHADTASLAITSSYVASTNTSLSSSYVKSISDGAAVNILASSGGTNSGNTSISTEGGTNSGDIIIETGAGSNSSGDITIRSTSSGNSGGNISISAGDGVGIQGGTVSIDAGSSIGGIDGIIQLRSADNTVQAYVDDTGLHCTGSIVGNSTTADTASYALTASYLTGSIYFEGVTNNNIPKWFNNSLSTTSSLTDNGSSVTSSVNIKAPRFVGTASNASTASTVFNDNSDAIYLDSGTAWYTQLKIDGVAERWHFSGDIPVSASGFIGSLTGSATRAYTATTATSSISSSWATSASFAKSASISNLVQTSLDSLSPVGFITQTTSTLSYDTSSKVFAISGSNFEVYISGQEYFKSTEGIVIPGAVGELYYLYYDGTTTALTYSVSEWPFSDGSCPIATVYVGGNGNYIIGEERHGIVMDWSTHRYLHDTFGPRYSSGLTATVATSSLGVVSIGSGKWHDDDLLYYNANPLTSSTLVYYSGSGIFSQQETRSIWGGGTPQYCNPTTGVTASLGTSYGAYFLYAVNGYFKNVISIMGQRTDTNIANCRANNTPDSLVLGAFPVQEYKLLYRVIVRNSDIQELTDYRSAQYAGSTSTATDHGTLAGLQDDDHPQYVINTGVRGAQNVLGILTTTGSLLGTASLARTASYLTTTNNYTVTNLNLDKLITNGCNASGIYSVAVGDATLSDGPFGLTQGRYTKISQDANYGHSEGDQSVVSSSYGHAEGDRTLVRGTFGHAEGTLTTVIGTASHAEGSGTIASGSYQHVSGWYNKQGNTTDIFIIGDGVYNNRHDIVNVSSASVRITGSLSVDRIINATASYATSASYAQSSPSISASYATTASYALNGGGGSSTYTLTASDVFTVQVFS